MNGDDRLSADEIAALESGDAVTFNTSIGAWGSLQIHVGKVARLTAKQVVVHYDGPNGTVETRFRKDDAGKVGEGYGFLLNPTHPTTTARLARARRERRQRAIDALAARWSRERDNLDVLRRLQVAIGEYLDGHS